MCKINEYIFTVFQREKLIHELEEERHLRLESEKRLREVTLESERSRAQMRGLQEQFSRYVVRVNCIHNMGKTHFGAETLFRPVDNLNGSNLRQKTALPLRFCKHHMLLAK